MSKSASRQVFFLGLGGILLVSSVVTFALEPDLSVSVGRVGLPAGVLVIGGGVLGLLLIIGGLVELRRQRRS
jgi:hypothetical protein